MNLYKRKCLYRLLVIDIIMKIGIIGYGFVGKATSLFAKLPEIEQLPVCFLEDTNSVVKKNITDEHTLHAFYPFKPTATATATATERISQITDIQVMIYDIRCEACVPYGVTLQDIDTTCDILFFCLPTPLFHDGSCYTKILEDCISKCKNPYKVIRSTVPVGFSNDHDCYFMPEFLTEANWENDFKTTEKWIIGIPSEHSKVYSETEARQHIRFKHRIHELITASYKNKSIDSSVIVFCNTNEAEMLKLSKNCFLSAKVSIMNEIFDFCSATHTDYDKVIEMAKIDARMGTSHFNVPGPDGRRGFGGTCFPKDTHSIYYQMTKYRVNTSVFPAVLSRNDMVDRPAREWANDVGRTTVSLPKDSKIVVVFDDGNFTKPISNSADQYLTSLCIDKLQNNHYVIIITSECECKDKLINIQLRKYLDSTLLIKIHDMTKQIFIPRIDEIYFAGYNTSMQPMHELSSITRVLELWTQHQQSYLFVTKPNHIYSSYTRLFEDMNKKNDTSRLIVLF